MFGCIDRATIKGTSLGENMATGIDISEFIVASPDICNSRPRIAGTRITIQSLVMDLDTAIALMRGILGSLSFLNLAGRIQPNQRESLPKRISFGMPYRT